MHADRSTSPHRPEERRLWRKPGHARCDDHYEGRGVGQNYRKAKEWFDKAVEQGHTGAQVNLGTLYLRGEGTPQSSQMALFWFTRAAGQEDALALAKLGLMYSQGRGALQDFIQAHMWYNLSAARGEARFINFARTLLRKYPLFMPHALAFA